jgi:hypothetical protein
MLNYSGFSISSRPALERKEEAMERSQEPTKAVSAQASVMATHELELLATKIMALIDKKLRCASLHKIVFFYVGPLKESIFLTTFYGLNFSHQLHMLQITILFHDIDHLYYTI